MLSVIGQVGTGVLGTLAGIGAFGVFVGQTFSWFLHGLTHRRNLRLIPPQLYEVGVLSVPVVLVTGMFIGCVVAVQTYDQFARIGLASRLGSVINLSLVKELGPVLAGVMLAGRVGGALTAEIGTMRVTEQIDALRAMGADPVSHLVVPRFFACLLLTPLLTLYADFMGVIGGWLICVKVKGINAALYWTFSETAVGGIDLATGVIKSVFFGGALALIACYKGFTSRPGARGVGRACTEAFVASFIAILVLDFFLAIFLKGVSDLIWVGKEGIF